MSLFPSAHNFTISGGNFTSTSVNNHFVSGASGLDILLEASEPDAAYDSSARDWAARCHPGTREQYIEDIINWANPSIVGTIPLPLFRMKGPAGVGKSAIAQTCIEKLREMSVPCAGFFFTVNKRHKPERFFPSIAYQLSTLFPSYADLIDRKIQRDKTLLKKSLQAQFQGLIIEPLKELKKNGQQDDIPARVPIVVDGLDECEGADAQCKIIELVATFSGEGISPLCWAFFSRPEAHIEAAFSRRPVALKTYSVILPISRKADREIEMYLRAGFENIVLRLGLPVGYPWPSEEEIQALVDSADGLFVYGATALRFISDPSWPGPEEPLRIVLASSSNPTGAHDSKSLFSEMDTLYLLIMQRIPPAMLHPIRLLLTQLCAVAFAFEPISASRWCNMLGLSTLQFRGICNQLNAVLHFQDQTEPLPIPIDVDTRLSFLDNTSGAVGPLVRFVNTRLGGQLRFYHKSFYDFLRDPQRSGSFNATSIVARNELIHHYLNVLHTHDKCYSFQDNVLMLAPGVPNSHSSLSSPSTNELINSMIKRSVYRRIFDHCRFDFPWVSEGNPMLGGMFVQCDFRVALYLKTRGMTSGTGIRTFFHDILLQPGLARTLCDGIRLFSLSRDTFQAINTKRFRNRITSFENGGVLTKLPKNPHISIPRRDNCESGLYVFGRDGKSTFWFWEINVQEQWYREVECIDLAEGMRIYLAESFQSWQELMVVQDSERSQKQE